MKPNFNKIGKNVTKMFYENREAIEYVLGLTVASLALYRVSKGDTNVISRLFFGQPITFQTPKPSDTSNVATTVVTRNATESAIVAIYNGITSTNSDYYRMIAAEKIKNILDESSSDDLTRRFAISHLDKISRSMSSNYYKSCVNDLIYEIATGG